ncbi:TetR/AcrR family transcriptional regulator [Candidatus Mycobacterium wuenschmannii]|uniref:TetR/AcrR family transcriptional regulator n=1 Tax=Candidatus Mycobacterium wuenschmannii TaxID=3027808 RepID=A0ABY8VT84_9MYCO|nr:TetR/AcrR family transcriptional regulator [Candidatus Mycobacterium wuenschmannii]WIM86838.1 TetR/AcrR family transcriptional regulator [Candidatus Mycobacterium wuenschmannii]
MSPAPRPQVRDALLTAAREELAEHGRAAISLRAVARRAGLSHASPKYHFGDRSGLLTAIAAEGFHALALSLSGVREPDARRQLAALGRAYIDFGLAHPALFELMFAPRELHTDDPELVAAQQRAIGALTIAVSELIGIDPATPDSPPSLALIAWALVHGLVVLTRDGALQSASAPTPTDAAELAHGLAEQFAAMAGDNLALSQLGHTSRG